VSQFIDIILHGHQACGKGMLLPDMFDVAPTGLLMWSVFALFETWALSMYFCIYSERGIRVSAYFPTEYIFCDVYRCSATCRAIGGSKGETKG
jgi:hypothetical protein